MNCTHCSAKIPGDALTCPYCGHETPNFAKARAQADEQRRHAEQQALIDAAKGRQFSVAGLESSARTAFYWSLAGVVVCCLPIGSVVGLVLGLRVRKQAASLNAHAPWQSMAAMVISIAWLGLFVLFLTIGIVTDHQRSVRVGELREATKAKATGAELDAETACALVEMTLLEGGAGQKSGSIHLFKCEGVLETTAEGGAVIKDIELARHSGDKPSRVDGCLSRGSRWRVDAIGTGPGCQQGRDGGE